MSPALGAVIGGITSGLLFAAVVMHHWISALIEAHDRQSAGWALFLLSTLFVIMVELIVNFAAAIAAAVPGALAGWWAVRRRSALSGALAGLLVGGLAGGALAVIVASSQPPSSSAPGYWGIWLTATSIVAGFAAGLAGTRS